jgi:hypothetical protein
MTTLDDTPGGGMQGSPQVVQLLNDLQAGLQNYLSEQMKKGS